MKKIFVLLFMVLLLAGGKMSENKVKLPESELKGKVSFEETLVKRRSIRKFKKGNLTLQSVSQLLWAAYGITDKDHELKTTPSAGATYPLIIYCVAGNVNELEPGVYKYLPEENVLIRVIKGDKRTELMAACLFQKFIKDAQINIVICADFKKTTSVYEERGVMYVHMEAGHSGQNIYLQAEALNLGTVAVGAFNEYEVKKLLKLSDNEKPLYIFPVGLK